MNARVWDQVGLELVQVDIQCTIEPQARGNGADDLSNEAVEVVIVGAGNVEAATADVIDSFVVDEECAVGVLNGAMCGQNSVVRLDDRGRDARRRVNGKLQLALLAVVGGQTLQQQGTESRSSATAERVENKETLKGRAVIWVEPLTKDSNKAFAYRAFLPATRRMRSMTLSTISLPMV